MEKLSFPSLHLKGCLQFNNSLNTYEQQLKKDQDMNNDNVSIKLCLGTFEIINVLYILFL